MSQVATSMGNGFKAGGAPAFANVAGAATKGLRRELTRTLLNLDAIVQWQILEFLYQAIGPSDRRFDRLLPLSNAEKQFLGVLGKKSRPCLQIFCLPQLSRFNSDRSADSVAIAFVPSKAK